MICQKCRFALCVWLPLFFSTGCFALESPGKSGEATWGETQRPAREDFQPQVPSSSFNLEASLLKNSGLKAGSNPEKPPSEWEASARLWKNVYKAPDSYSQMVRVEEDPEILFQGRPSVRISVGPTEEEVYLELYQEISMKKLDLRGKKLRLSFYAYREAPPPGREFFLVGPVLAKGPEGKSESIASILEIHPVIPPGKWTCFSKEDLVPPEAEVLKISFRHIFQGKDKLWLSGFLLETVSTN